MLLLVWSLSSLVLLQGQADSSGPTKCELCRLVSVELERELEKQIELRALAKEKGTEKDSFDRKSLLDATMKQVCANMYSYEVQTEDQSALKYRRNSERNMEKMSKLLRNAAKMLDRVGLQNNMESLIDPTGQLKQLAKQCQDFVDKHNKGISTWFLNHQDTVPLVQHLCTAKVTKDDTSCLTLRLLNVDKEKAANTKEKSGGDQSKTEGNEESSDEGETSDKDVKKDEVKLEHMEL